MPRIAASILPTVTLLAACAGLGPGPAAPATVTVPAARGAAPTLTYATYEWNVDDAVSRWQAGTLWSWTAQHHVYDILAGFNDAQIAKYSSGTGKTEFNEFVSDAASHGVKIELLLGTPQWILPSGIASLKALLHQMRGLHFTGVNLDLEPNEVHGMPMKTVVNDLIAAMHEYVRASPWSVTLDVNWFYANPSRTGGVCLLCGLQSAGLRNVDLMTYISDPSTVYANDAPTLEKYPFLNFGIAQSVEPPSVLPPGDSYWADGFAKFYAEMIDLNALFAKQPNYRGLVVESMQYLETMKP